MRLSSNYFNQVKTLIDIVPLISSDERFAIKGGTAINLFLFDMPRLSVDIDLCYLPLKPRDQALTEISQFIETLSYKSESLGLKTRKKPSSSGYESTLFILFKKAQVKVEINLVVRGAVYQTLNRSLSPKAKDMFKRDVSIQCLSEKDLFAGKICAALDRQHPRDFFDLFMYFKNVSYDRELHQTVILYLLSSKRPLSELISPNKLNIKTTYESEFKGMTTEEISCQKLEETQAKIFECVLSSLTDQDKEFLLSFKRGEPKWGLLPIKNAQHFPAVKWKLFNIQRMEQSKRKRAIQLLEEKLKSG